MRLHPINDAAWSFETDQFFVGFYAEPECLDPADSFQFEEDIEAVRNGSVEWFAASVRVFVKRDSDEPRDWQEVGADHLGGCAYNSVREFFVSHRDADPMNRNCTIMRRKHEGKDDPDAKVSICHYFPGMVREAISDARATLCRMPKVRCA